MTTRKLTEKNEANGSFPGENDALLTQHQCLLVLSQTIKILHTRVNGVQLKEKISDSANLGDVRALVAILKVYDGLLKDFIKTEKDNMLSDMEAGKSVVDLELAIRSYRR